MAYGGGIRYHCPSCDVRKGLPGYRADIPVAQWTHATPPADRLCANGRYLIVDTQTERVISRHVDCLEASRIMLAMPSGNWGVADDATSWRRKT